MSTDTQFGGSNFTIYRGCQAEGCHKRARKTKLQDGASSDEQLCADCFIARCPHPGKRIRPPISEISCCARCGVELERFGAVVQPNE